MAPFLAPFRDLVRALAIVLALLAATPPAAALEELDRLAARSAIERQLDAFRRDDAAAAYDLASPSIQGMFPTKDIFLEMVRRGYPPVYRPRSFEFGPARDEGGLVEQSVRIQDGDGVDWDAVYSLERQPDGTWRISGCRLVKRPGESA